jgi:hypothetical protein
VTFTVVATDNVAVSSYSVTGATFSSKSGNNYYFTRTYSYGSYSFGSVTQSVTASFSDAAGNTSTSSLNVTVTKTDNQAPSISSFGANDTSVTLTTSSQTQTVTFTAVATDNVGISSYSINQGASFSSLSGNTYTFTKTYSYGNYSFGTTNETVTVTFTDAAGNSASSSVAISVSKSDNQGPSIGTITISDSTVTLTSSSQTQTITFTATVTDNVAVSAVSMNQGASFLVQDGSSYTFRKTYNYSSYSFGTTSETLTMTATDSAGNSSTRTATVSVSKTDNQAPSISSLTASSSTVNLTAGSQTQVVTFVATMTDNVGISSYSMNNGATYVSSSGNDYTFSKTYSYSDYSFGSTSETLTLTVTDAAGNQATDTVTVTVNKTDTQAPSISSFTVNDSTVVLTTSSQSQTVTFSVTAADNVGISSVTVNQGASYSSQSGSTYTFTKTYKCADYSFGSQNETVTATALDAAGNIATASLTVNVSKSDNQAPSISNFTPSVSSISLTNENTSQAVFFTATLTDNRAVTGYSLSPGGSFTGVSGTTYTFQKTFQYDDYSNGTTVQTMTLTAQDAAGNSSTATTEVTVQKSYVDSTAPTISILSASTTTISLPTSDPTETVTITADITDDVGVTSASIPGATYVGLTGNTYTWNYTFAYGSYSFGETSTTLTLTAADAAGNSSSSSISFTVTKSDDEDPVISNLAVSASSVALTTTSQSKTITITADLTDNVGISSATASGATLSSTSGSTYTWSKTYTYSSYSFGSTTDTIVVTVSDGAGNTASSSINVTVTKTDNQAPTIGDFGASPSSVTLLSSSQSQTITFTATILDNVGVTSATIPGATLQSTSSGVYTWTKTYSYGSYNYGSSSETITVTATDSAGNTATDSLTLNISKTDDQAPTIQAFTANNTGTVIDGDWPAAWVESTTWPQNLGGLGEQSSNVFIVASATMPSSASDGCLFEAGGGGKGTFVGIVNSKFRVTAGDGGDANTASDADTAVISISLPDERIPLDGAVHEIAVAVYTYIGTIRLYVDGVLIAQAVSTSGAFDSSQWQGGDAAGFGEGYSSMASGGTIAPWPAGASGQLGLYLWNVGDAFSMDKSTLNVSLPTSNPTQDVTYSVAASDNVAVTGYSLPGGSIIGLAHGVYQWKKTYAYGSYSFGTTTTTSTVTVTDDQAQSATASITDIVSKTDDENPVISSFSVSDSTITLTSSSQSQTVTFTAVISDNVAVTTYLLAGTTFVSKVGNTYTWSKTFSYADFSYGSASQTYSLLVTDSAGNSASGSLTVSITKTDDQNPTISSFTVSDASVTLLTSSQSQTITYSATVSDNVSVSSVSLPGATPVDTVGPTYTWSETFSYGSYSFGSTSVTRTLTATDSTGNTSTSSLTVTVTKSDDQSPAISSISASPSSVTLTTSAQTATVTISVVATDNVGISSITIPGATYSSVSGSTYTWTKTLSYADYAFGSNTQSLTVTAVDAAGNSSSDTVLVPVTKVDNEAPTISSFTANDTSVSLSTSSQSQVVTFTVDATDNVGVASVAVTGASLLTSSGSEYVFSRVYSYDDYSFGPTSQTVTATVTDTAGNSSTDTINITVSKVDDQQPTITSFSVNDSTVTLSTSSQSQTVTFSLVASDNRAVTSVSLPGATTGFNNRHVYSDRKRCSWKLGYLFTGHYGDIL